MVSSISVEKATLYEKYRLPYADKAVDDLLARTGQVRVVADIGAGTGQLAKLFANRSEKVFLVEPDTAMRKVAARVLADFATIKIRAGTAEQTARKIEKNWHRTPVEKLFGHDQMQTLCYPQSHTEGWEAFWGAARAGIEAPERHERDFARFEALNREVFEAFAVDSKIVIEYDSRVLFGQPRLK